ncbi:hypothetical protein KIW84_015834 [Lathyrus oleraceus]|uniref:Zinc finger, CCHC-type n=1 Tax=Pisum sativum TaxID=3888 RepID=A0A9D5H0Y2_PEA|nr:hypothetical protein KIW84_015834 [Pisum sativum]
MYLRGRGKIGYIIGDKKQPDKADADYDTWDVENSMVMTWLVNSMDEEICANYLCKDTAKELWEGVSQMYYDLENQSQIYELTLKLGEIRQDEGLNANFDEVRGRIIGRNPIPPIGEVFSEVRREESRRQVMLDKNTSVVPPPIEGSALAIPHGESQCNNKEDNFWETWSALEDIVTTNHPSAKIIESETGGETLIKDDNPELKVYVRKKFHKGGANHIVSPLEIQSDLPSEGHTDNLSSSSSSGNPF